jgi:hypothetical protein
VEGVCPAAISGKYVGGARPIFVKNREGITALRSWMPYLHGDIIDKEFAAACFYEYERQRQFLDNTAQINEEIERLVEQDKIEFAERSENTHKNVHKFPLLIDEVFRCGLSFKGYARMLIRDCPSFPKKDWNQLSRGERANVLLGFVPSQIQPLETPEVWLIDAWGILKKLQMMAAKVMKDNRHHKPNVYAIVEELQRNVHVRF